MATFPKGIAFSRYALPAYYFLSFAAFGAYLPFFPRWLEARSVHGMAMGAIMALLPMMGIVAPPFIGALADALGIRGSILRVASTVAASSFATVALLVDAHGALRSALALTLAFALFAAARTPIMLVADVLALESLGDAKHRYGELRLWGSLGFIAGAMFVGFSFDPELPRALPLFIAALFATSSVISFALPAASTASLSGLSKTGLRSLISDWPFMLCLALSQASHSAYDVCYSLHLRDLGVSSSRVAIAWAIGVVFEVALLVKSSALLSRFGGRTLLAMGLAGAALRWAAIALVSGFWWAAAFQPLHAFSFACVWIASVDMTAAHPRLATARGVASAAMGVGGAIGLVVCSTEYAHYGGRAVFAMAALVAMLALVFALPKTPRARY